jgi:hypothetical protein
VTKLNQLYSALYFMHLLPTKKTGENPSWQSSEPYYDDMFTFLDIVCLTCSFLMLFFLFAILTRGATTLTQLHF